MGKDDCKIELSQDIHWGDCICPVPWAVFTENTRYEIKDGGKTAGSLEEESSFICRMCIPAGARTLKNTIKLPGGAEYHGLKNFQLGYACPCCCTMRPDIIVQKGESVVGAVVQPCCPAFLCKMELDLYKGEGREENHKLCKIKKCCCNCHTLFGKACGCCLAGAATLTFEVTGNGTSPELHKHYNGFINECTNMADKYLLNWGSGGDDEKAIFLNAVHFIDLMWFENNYMACGGV
jgi:hypothetical protein